MVSNLWENGTDCPSNELEKIIKIKFDFKAVYFAVTHFVT